METTKSEDRNVTGPQRLKFAYYVTGHGFGHATRVVEVLLDCGAVQADALTVDRLASLEKYSRTAVVPRVPILATEVDWLNSIKADLVISDVVPVACRAAAEAGIPVVCVTNFSWDFIYAEYVMEAGHLHRSIVWQIAEDYSHCLYLLRLPGYCPMPAFRDVIDVPLVVRRTHRNRQEVRKELGIGDDIKVLIFNFGGQEASWALKEESLPPSWICLVCAASPKQEFPRNFRRLPTDVYTPDLIAASDCMLGKIGYGTVSEALAYKIPFVFVRRDYFNEEPFLRNTLEYYNGGVEMIRRDLLIGHWIPYLDRALKLKPCYDEPINGGEVAARILQNTAIGKLYTSDKTFAALLSAASTDEQLSALGELLYQSHYSYSKCGLGSDGTDRIVNLVQQMQHGKKNGGDDRKGTLFGAKITGGGSGGTVCVLGRNCIQSSEDIIEIQQRYKAATGHLPFIFEGSSPGAGKFGHLKIQSRFDGNSVH